jgi:hypothetical protein
MFDIILYYNITCYVSKILKMLKYKWFTYKKEIIQ